MADQPTHDEFLMIRIEGMHCHRCQQAIQKALQANAGVHEVEVDFPSGQASVLYDPSQVTIRQLLDTVTEAGYRAAGFSQGRAGRLDTGGRTMPPTDGADRLQGETAFHALKHHMHRTQDAAHPGLLGSLPARPAEERVRECRYRFGQAMVFGLPVLFLHHFGQQLGGAEAGRWSGLLQALLAGWVMYVGAAGLVFEGLLWLWHQRVVSGGLIVSGSAVSIYLFSVFSWICLLGRGEPWPAALHFDWSVLLVMGWAGLQWWRFSAAMHRRR